MVDYSLLSFCCKKKFPIDLEWLSFFGAGEIDPPIKHGDPYDYRLCILSSKRHKTVKNIIYILKFSFDV